MPSTQTKCWQNTRNVMADSTVLYEKIIFENLDKGFQLRVVVNDFRDIEYLHIRKYFLSYEGDFVPTKEGISIPMTIQNIYSLLDALIEVCSKAEGLDSLLEHFEQKILDLQTQE